MKTRICTFCRYDVDKLDNIVNDFLEILEEKSINDIKFSTSLNSEGIREYAVMIVYEEY